MLPFINDINKIIQSYLQYDDELSIVKPIIDIDEYQWIINYHIAIRDKNSYYINDKDAIDIKIKNNKTFQLLLEYPMIDYIIIKPLNRPLHPTCFNLIKDYMPKLRVLDLTYIRPNIFLFKDLAHEQYPFKIILNEEWSEKIQKVRDFQIRDLRYLNLAF